MKLFPEQKDKRRLAVTAGLLLLAAVLLFAAEALLDNLHGRPSGETESIGIDALTLSGAEAQDGSFTLSGVGSAVFDIRPADVGNVTFSIHASEDRICRVRVSLKTGACLETFVQYNLYEFFSQDGTVTVPLDARDVRSVRLTFEDSCRGLTVTDITVNAQPDGFSFNLGRYLLLFFVAALLILIFRLRLWRIRYRADSPNCRALLFFVTTLLLIPAIFCASTQEKLTEAYPLEKPVEEYGCYVQLFDAFQKGQLHLDIDAQAELISSLENPYDRSQREALGIGAYQPSWDRALYEGKFYVYFGVAPVLLIYYPFYFLTGALPTDLTVMAILSAAGVVFMTLLFLELLRRFAPNAPFLLVLLGVVMLPAASLLYMMATCGSFYYAAVLSGVVCCCAFLYFTLRAEARADGGLRKALFALAGFFLAATVASRPNLALYLLIVLPLLIGILVKRPNGLRSTLWDVAAFAAPLAVCGGLLMVYNYARFGSVFDFGNAYQITVADTSQYSFSLLKLFPAAWHYFLQPPEIDCLFPYIHPAYDDLRSYGGYIYNTINISAAAIPASAGVLLAFRTGWNDRYGKIMCRTVPAVCLLMAFFEICFAGVHIRYAADILFPLLVFGAVMLCRFVGERLENGGSLALSYTLASGAMLVSLLTGLALMFDNEPDYIVNSLPDIAETVRNLFS